MTAKDLIEQLKQLPEYKEVVILALEGDDGEGNANLYKIEGVEILISDTEDKKDFIAITFK